MMEKAKIFLDFDETLVMSIKSFIDVYKERHRDKIKSGEYPYPIWEGVAHWNFQDELPKIHLGEVDDIFNSHRLFDNLAFYADSDGTSMWEVVAMLCAMQESENTDFSVYIASKGNERNLEYKADFIKEKLPFFPIENFIPMRGTVMNKSELYGLVLFDDNQDNLYTANVKYRVLVNFSGEEKEWNTKAMRDDNIIKCFSVADFRRVLNEIARKEKLSLIA